MVEWKDGSSSFISLKYLKASNTVELAKYVAVKHLDIEPAFKWWVRDVLRRCNRIIAKVNAKYWRMKHKFGIQAPKSVDKDLAIDKKNVNTLW